MIDAVQRFKIAAAQFRKELRAFGTWERFKKFNADRGRTETVERRMAEGWSPSGTRAEGGQYIKPQDIQECYKQQLDPYEHGLGDPPYSSRQSGRVRRDPPKYQRPAGEGVLLYD